MADYSLLTLLHDRAASLLNDAATVPPDGGVLLAALRDPNVTTPDIDIEGLLERFQMLDLFKDGGTGGPLTAIRGRFQELIAGFEGGQGLDGVLKSLQQIHQGQADVIRGRLLGALTRQVGIGISFVTTLRNLANVPQVGERILNGWKDYFFGEGGFVTVDGMTIVAPGHDVLGQIGQGVRGGAVPSLDSFKGLKGLLNERSAEQYVRDLIRITVEVAADTRYSGAAGNLRERYRLMGEKVSENLGADVGQKNQEKAARWFKGAASMAESLVTSTVEEAALGVAQFQTNPIIAASAATYAGTAARKATQHAFLSKVGV